MDLIIAAVDPDIQQIIDNAAGASQLIKPVIISVVLFLFGIAAVKWLGKGAGLDRSQSNVEAAEQWIAIHNLEMEERRQRGPNRHLTGDDHWGMNRRRPDDILFPRK